MSFPYCRNVTLKKEIELFEKGNCTTTPHIKAGSFHPLMVVLLALSLSIFAIPASSAEESYLKKRNSILFDCYGKTKTPEQFSSCVAPQMTKSNGFLKDVSMNCNGAGLIAVSCD